MQDEINRRLKIIEAFKGKNIVRLHYLTNPSRGYVYYGDSCMKNVGLFIKKNEPIEERNVMIVSALGLELLFEESDKTIEFLKDNCISIDADPLTGMDYVNKVIMEDIRGALLLHGYDHAHDLVHEASLISEGKYLEYLEFKKQ